MVRETLTPEQVKALRARVGDTQQEFAIRLRVSIQSVQKWEQGKAHPQGLSLDALERLQKQTTKKEQAT